MRFSVLTIFNGDIMDGHPISLSCWILVIPASTSQKIAYPSVIIPSEMDKKKMHPVFNP